MCEGDIFEGSGNIVVGKGRESSSNPQRKPEEHGEGVLERCGGLWVVLLVANGAGGLWMIVGVGKRCGENGLFNLLFTRLVRVGVKIPHN